VVRNIGQLRKQALKYPDALTLYLAVFNLLRIHFCIDDNVDEDAPVAVILLNPKGVGGNAVIAIPFKDRDKLACSFNKRVEDLKEGMIFTRKKKGFFLNHCCVRGQHLLMADDEKALQSLLK